MVARGSRRVAGYALIGVAGVLLILAALMVTEGMGGPQPALVGTQLDGRQAPDFTLTDHRGQPVRLSDFRGKAVVLTFIYTSCPDVCPLIAENLRVAYELLSEDVRGHVALVAVTVDPARDTEQALREFTARHRLADNRHWFALRGDVAALERVGGTTASTPGGAQRPQACRQCPLVAEWGTPTAST